MIRVIDDYVICADTKCYTVGQLRTFKNNKTGEVKSTIGNTSFFHNLEDCLKEIRERLQRTVVDEMDGNLMDAINAIRESDERYIDAITRCGVHEQYTDIVEE